MHTPGIYTYTLFQREADHLLGNAILISSLVNNHKQNKGKNKAGNPYLQKISMRGVMVQ